MVLELLMGTAMLFAASTAEEIAKYESGGDRAADPTEQVVTAPKNMKLILCIGQSNMAGRAKLTEADKALVPHVYKLNRDDQWVAAKSPYHFDKQAAAMGPVDQFVKDYLKDHPNDTIGVVPCAVGGTSIATWMPGRKGKSFTRAVARAKAAAANGTFIAILWHQGETDVGKLVAKAKGGLTPEAVSSFQKGYAAKVEKVITSFRAELGADVPAVVGEIGRWKRRDGEHAALINPATAAAAQALPRCGLASSEVLKNQDSHHFNREGQIALGHRYYEAWKKLQ